MDKEKGRMVMGNAIVDPKTGTLHKVMVRKPEDELYHLSQAMFENSLPCNPIPFANGLVKGCKENGTDWIQSNTAKRILFILIQQAYGTAAFELNSFKEFQYLLKRREMK